MSRLFWLLSQCLVLMLLGCNAPRPATEGVIPAPESDQQGWPQALAAQPLERCTESDESASGLEVGVVVFDAGIENFDSRDARHKLRQVEGRLAAATLRDTLMDSGCWGPSRVLPSASQFAGLTVQGKIIHSDGRDLVVRFHVIDATEEVWFSDTLRASATAKDYQRQSSRPFLNLYIALANELQRAAVIRGAKALQRLEQTALLRYAAELAPDAFAHYLEERDGRTVLKRLPANNDPMLQRIDRIRNQEALFIDTVDEQYVELRRELDAAYRLWRQSSFEQAAYLELYTARATGRELNADAGSFAAMQQVYSTYRSVRIQEQDLFELATGFDNETAPTVMQSGDQVVRLSGTLDQQYQEWRRILSQIIRLERGLLP